jgi:signal transduction histidine kinase
MLSIIGDEKTLRQLITILLDNALKYSTEQGTITLSLSQQTKFICLTVENTISPSNSIEPDRLFDRFYRGDESRNSQTGGYGLGLSIAKAIIDSHKGKVRVTKKENSILSIKILFPRVKW